MLQQRSEKGLKASLKRELWSQTVSLPNNFHVTIKLLRICDTCAKPRGPAPLPLTDPGLHGAYKSFVCALVRPRICSSLWMSGFSSPLAGCVCQTLQLFIASGGKREQDSLTIILFKALCSDRQFMSWGLLFTSGLVVPASPA